MGVTPDGPRGPARQLAPGALAAAQRAQAPLVALRAHAASAWRFRSWDRFLVPKPFARVTIAYGPVTYVPAGDPAVLEQARLAFAAVMSETGRRAGDVD